MTTGKDRKKGQGIPNDDAVTAAGEGPKSLLSRGAPRAGEPPFEPWFRNDDKLLAAVVDRAARDSTFAARVAAAVGKLAQQQPGLRKKLHLSAAGGKRGARGRSPATLAHVADTFLHLQKQQPRGARAAAIQWVLGAHFGIDSVAGAARLVDAARREFPFGSNGAR